MKLYDRKQREARNQSIKAMHAAGVKYKDIAARHQISTPLVWRIVRPWRERYAAARHAERNQRIADLYIAGVSKAKIAEQFGLKIGSIYHMVEPWVEQRAQVKAERERRVAQMYIAGTPEPEIAKQFGISTAAVYGIAHRADPIAHALRLKGRVKHHQRVIQEYTTDTDLNLISRAERSRRMVKMRAEGLTLQEVGDVFGVTRERVRQIQAKHERIQRRAEMIAAKVPPSDPLTERIEDMPLSIRSSNALRRENITTLGDLLKYSERELLWVPGLGTSCLEEVREALRDCGYRIGGLKITETDECLLLRQKCEVLEARCHRLSAQVALLMAERKTNVCD